MNERFTLSKSNKRLWISDLKEALANAKLKGQLILISFLDEGEASKKVESKIFKSKEFLDFAKENKLVLLKSVGDRKLLKRLNLFRYPSTLLVNHELEFSQIYYRFYEYEDVISAEDVTNKISEAVSNYRVMPVDPFQVLKNNDINLFTYAINQKCDFNKMKQNKTLAMLAAELGNEEAIKLLCEKGVDLAFKNKKGQTAYDYATANGYTDLSKYIEENIR